MWKTFVHLFDVGGWVLYPIFAISVLAWFIGLRQLGIYTQSSRFLKKVSHFLSADGETEPATGSTAWDTFALQCKQCNSSSSSWTGITDHYTQIASQFSKGLSTLGAYVVIAPLLGLLGTITGMNEMFSVIGTYGYGNPGIMAGGISMALQATLTGLGLAVAILLLQNYLINRSTGLLHVIEAELKHLSGYTQQPQRHPQGAPMLGNYRLVPQETEKPDINLAPFVDTIMILLIFFVVTANLYVETGISVAKPRAQSARSVGPKSVLIGVTREGAIHVYGRQVSLERLNALIRQEVSKQPELSIVIVADQNAVVGKAVQIMDQCLLAGAQKISLAAGK